MSHPSPPGTGVPPLGRASPRDRDDAAEGGGRGSAAAAPAWLTTAAAVAGKLLVLGAAILAAVWLLAQVAVVVLAIVVALLLTSVLAPAARRLRRVGLAPALAAATALLVAAAVLAGVTAALVPPVVAQFDALREDVTAGGEVLLQTVTEVSDDLGIPLDAILERSAGSIEDNFEAIGAGVFSGARTAVEIVAGGLLALVVTFFLLKDGEWIWRWALGHVPDGVRARVAAAGGGAWSTLSDYVRGQTIVAAADAVGIGVGLLLLGVPLVLPLAALTFITAYVPIVGALLAGAAAVLVALVDGGMVQALLAAAIVVAVQQMESNLLAPVVLGRALPLHPLAVLLSVTVGGVLAGIAGAFIAVPLVAAVTAGVTAVRRDRSSAVVT